MINKSAYLYFYDENHEYSRILHISVLCASIAFEKLYLCLSKKYISFFQTNCPLPDNIILICVDDDCLQVPLIKRLDILYASQKIRSNHPPVERHCINRWLFLQKKDFFNEKTIFSIDWDTLVFPGIAAYEEYLQDVDIAATNLMTLGWEKPPHEPIWSLCPNMLYLSKSALEYYIKYLNKYITYSEVNGSVVRELFCDMQPWSSVISTSLINKSKLKLCDFNELGSFLPLVDHNVRVIKDCGLTFKEMRYYFEHGTPLYLDTPYLKAKSIIFSNIGRPFFVLNSELLSDETRQNPLPILREAAAIHFSGVEAKHLMLQTFIEELEQYICLNLDSEYTKML
tara:strand:+ start:34 stop:1056 length:1023 start_codon:yes stop_codon:yes gene_type:complete